MKRYIKTNYDWSDDYAELIQELSTLSITLHGIDKSLDVTNIEDVDISRNFRDPTNKQFGQTVKFTGICVISEWAQAGNRRKLNTYTKEYVEQGVNKLANQIEDIMAVYGFDCSTSLYGNGIAFESYMHID